MTGPRKQKKGKTKAKAPKGPPPAPHKPPNSKLMLRVLPLSGATAQAPPPTVSPDNLKTPQLAPEAPPPLEEDSDMYVSEVPYVPSPRQEITDQFWGAYDQNEGLCSELSPNKATSHPQNVKAPGSPSAGGKRKASTHPSEQTSSVGMIDSDGTASDGSIQLAVSKKARKTPKESLIEDEDTDESLDKLFTGRKKGRKPSKKKREGDSDDDDKDSYKNSTSLSIFVIQKHSQCVAFVLFVPGAAGSAQRVELKSVAPYREALEVIYDNIGCLDVLKKPELSYKLSTSTAKAVSISLNSERDWEGFQKEVISQQKTKKRSIPVNILVPDRVRTITYHHDLGMLYLLLYFST